jgi:hypothetical protein
LQEKFDVEKIDNFIFFKSCSTNKFLQNNKENYAVCENEIRCCSEEAWTINFLPFDFKIIT